MSGFILTKLKLTGAGASDAIVEFADGLTVVSGPSDTGKTFIAQCIDFAMGAGKAPKPIPEAELYDKVTLSVRGRDASQEFHIERSLRGGPGTLRSEGEEDRILAEKHQADNEESISYFLLKLSGMSGKRIRTNQKGKTRPLSFRDLCRLAIVDEESVISESSPVFSSQYMKRTAETNVFRLLLTGRDDSSVVESSDRKTSKIRDEGKAEVIAVLLDRLRQRISDLDAKSSQADIQEQFERINASLKAASEQLASERDGAESLEERRRGAWAKIRKNESRLGVLSELKKRFALLKAQYSSDLRRLESIFEAGLRLEQLKEERCPVCGALADHHDIEHQTEAAAPSEVAAACRAEADKIQSLLADLETTSQDTDVEVIELTAERDGFQNDLSLVSSELKEVLEPRVEHWLQVLSASQEQRDKCLKVLGLFDRLEELQSLYADATNARKGTSEPSFTTAVGTDEAEGFSKEVESILRAWEFPDVERVVFSEEDQDLVISGRKRASHGKGVRAIFHAAFNIGLLRHCAIMNISHPGFVLIDSPLVVYREPDTDESGFVLDVKTAFYKMLAEQEEDCQVIILENEDPPTKIEPSANVIRFTGTEQGRRGFIPRSDNESVATE